MYHFDSLQLRVSRNISLEPENRNLLKNTRLIVLEHILPTTEAFLNVLKEAGCEIFAVIAKPYSIDPNVLGRLKKNEFNVIQKSYKELEDSDVLENLVSNANKLSEEDKKSVIIIDVGGYFAKILPKFSGENRGHVSGVVEDTTFGHNRYVNLLKANKIDIPIVSVARSELKKIEARFVGRDAVQAMDKLLRELGISITGRNALVIGYGMIGRNVARTLRSYDLNVYVYDVEDRQLLRAFTDGFHIHKKVLLLEKADIIFSATGSEAISDKPAMSYEDIEDCKHGVILASVGSKDSEFDVVSLENKKIKEATKLSDYLVKYDLPNSKYVIVANSGTAVNFVLPSLPVEILDIVFSEILQGVLNLLREEFPTNTINESELDALNKISKDWLRIVNV